MWQRRWRNSHMRLQRRCSNRRPQLTRSTPCRWNPAALPQSLMMKRYRYRCPAPRMQQQLVPGHPHLLVPFRLTRMGRQRQQLVQGWPRQRTPLWLTRRRQQLAQGQPHQRAPITRRGRRRLRGQAASQRRPLPPLWWSSPTMSYLLLTRVGPTTTWHPPRAAEVAE